MTFIALNCINICCRKDSFSWPGRAEQSRLCAQTALQAGRVELNGSLSLNAMWILTVFVVVVVVSCCKC